MIRKKIFKIGDLIKWCDQLALVLEKRDIPTDTGEYWYRVHLARNNRVRVIHQQDMEWA